MIDYTKSLGVESGRKSFDEGLRSYMLRVYNFMAAGVALTGIMAFATLNFAPLTAIMYNIGPEGQVFGLSSLGTVLTFAPLGIAIFFFMGIGRISVQTAQALFWAYAAVMGMSLSYLGLVYTGQSIAKTFFIAGAVFASMSIYGYTTQKDLTSMASFLIMGLIGLIIASLVNLFLRSSAIEFATSLIGVGIFMGLIAYDTQKLKSIYYQAGGSEMGQKMAIVGAFSLYLDFINLFLHLLRLLGDRK